LGALAATGASGTKAGERLVAAACIRLRMITPGRQRV
jgi:hypothetical protein